MSRSFCRRVLPLAIAVLCLAVSGFAQEFRATLTGQVSDQSGASIPGAKVTVKNRETNVETTVSTGEDGNYTIPLLQPGDYTLSVEAQGFKRAVNEGVQLHTADKATIDVSLEVGQLDQVITVMESEVALLESDTATRGQVIENRRVTELPLNGRNPIMLATLSPGVQFNGNFQFTRPFDNGDNAQFSINGGVQRHNEFLLDGAPNNAITDADTARTRSSNNIAYVPPVDATQEFKVQTNSYDSQYGRTGGGVINVTTKAGGNEFHGSAYEFFRRYWLEANFFENNAAIPARPRVKRYLDQYGGTFSGPMMLPRFGEGGRRTYNAKDRAFFFVAYERYREGSPAPRTVNVPTVLERRGDFSQSGLTIYDPLTTRCAVPNADPCPQFIRDPFPGNVIPQNRLNPVGFAIANGFPLPNNGAAGARTNNFISTENLDKDEFYNFVLRGDGNIGQNHHVFARYVRNRRNQFSGADYPGLGLDAQDPLVRANNGVALDLVTTISPTTVLNLRGTYTRFVQAAFRTRSSPFDATALGFPASFNFSRPVSIVPRFEVAGFNAFGPRNPSQNTTNTISLQGSLSLIRGQHSYKIGGEVRDNRINARGASFSWGGGQFTFSPNFTRRDPNVADVTQGSALASLLLGYPNGGTVDDLSRPGFRWKYYAAYLQDDFKVSRKLSLNLGLRYDYEAAPIERFDQQNRGFGFDQTSPLAAQIRNRPGFSECPACANLRGGLLFANVNGQPRQAFDADKNNFQPRVGVAYQFDDKTVLRGGYGLYYFPQAEFGGTTGFTISTPFVSTTGGGAQAFIPATTLSNPFPSGIQQPTGASQGLLTQAGSSIIFSNPERRIPRIHEFSFGAQRQLPWGFKFDLSYVGSRSQDILTNDFNIGNARNINVLTAQQLAEARANPGFYNAQVANPFAGLLPGTGLNGATVQRRQLLLPFPQFTTVTEALENVGEVWYDSLQASVEKRTARGLTVIVSYTYSKTLGTLSFLNNQDAEPSRAPTDFDRPHVLVASGVYQLPIGRGHRFAGDIGRGLNTLIGGWEYNWIARFQSGTPLQNPDLDILGDPRVANKSYDNYFNSCVLNRATGLSRATAVVNPATGARGFVTCTSPVWATRVTDSLRTTPVRTSTIRNPTAPQFDMSLNKTFAFTERYRAQFRAEAFNVTNTPIFASGPELDFNQATFGSVNRNTRNFPRQVQLALKFYF